MRKTSVYLTDDDVEALRRAAGSSGRSQAELIRDGVRHIVSEAQPPKRVFRSMGVGHGGGQPYSSWRSRDLLEHLTREA
ncbi:MAG: CopG family transcriptional regulator [Candidatus Dormibacteraceae bacterium]